MTRKYKKEFCCTTGWINSSWSKQPPFFYCSGATFTYCQVISKKIGRSQPIGCRGIRLSPPELVALLVPKRPFHQVLEHISIWIDISRLSPPWFGFLKQHSKRFRCPSEFDLPVYTPENQHDIGKSLSSIRYTSSNGEFPIVMLVFVGVFFWVSFHPRKSTNPAWMIQYVGFTNGKFWMSIGRLINIGHWPYLEIFIGVEIYMRIL